MPVTPSSILNSPLTSLRTFLANSATFQALTGAASAAAAEAFIFLYEEDDIPAGGNYIVVDHAGGWGMNRRQPDNSWTPQRGGLYADIVVKTPTAYVSNPADAFANATNQIGAILNEVQTYCATRMGLVIYGWKVAMGPMRAAPEERKGGTDYISALIEFEVQ